MEEDKIKDYLDGIEHQTQEDKPSKKKTEKMPLLDEELILAINDQIQLEQYSTLVYDALGAWCDCYGFKNIAQWLYVKANEERTHKQKLINYLADTRSEIIIYGDDAPEIEADCLYDLFNLALEHEIRVKDSLASLQLLAEEKEDRMTYNFLNWFLIEQIEEIKTFIDYLDELELIGEDRPMMWHFDQEFKK